MSKVKSDARILDSIKAEIKGAREMLELHALKLEEDPTILTKADKIGRIIDIALDLPSAKQAAGRDMIIAWHVKNAYSNDLPDQSSGSYRTALGDIDGMATSLLDETHENFSKHYEYLEELYNIWIKPIL